MSGSSAEELREELERTRAELWQARDRIATMEMSRFWKLRNLWWTVKRRFGISVPPAAPALGDAAAPADVVRLRGLAPVPFRAGPPPAHPHRVDVIFVAGPDEAVSRAALDSLVRFCRPPVAFFVAGVAASERPDSLAALCRDLDASVSSPGPDALARALRAGRSPLVFVAGARGRLLVESLDRLVACLESDPACVAAVPLSNGLLGAGPGAVEPDALSVAGESARLYPVLDAGGGSAFLTRRAALAGREAATPAELLQALRAAGAVRVADDVWMETGDARPEAARSASPALDGIAARLVESPARAGRRGRGLSRWEGKRVLFALPVLDRGGGANVVFSEARALAQFGVEARVFNLTAHRAAFEASYPSPPVPVIYGHTWDVVGLGWPYDAVVATANVSVEWIAPLVSAPKPVVLGYYVQDFEPLFYPEGSRDRAKAEASYGLVPGLRRFAKTEWNAATVREKTGLSCDVIGPSFDVDTFRPRLGPLPAAPVRIAAMIRPSTPRRQPQFTLEVLREVAQAHGDAVEILLFGVEDSDPALASLPLDFPHRFLGVLHERALAALFTQVQVFADFSTYQAMGLTALEAMGAGAAVLVPRAGGSDSFARDGENAVLVDTASRPACVEALSRLVADPARRAGLAARALGDVARHTPESAAFRMLEVLFGAA
ncbi:MAG TPA: glycosyltransferase family 4 protein [Thermoanaerobaculia bacterium]